MKRLSLLTNLLKWLFALVGAIVLYYVGYNVYQFFKGFSLNPFKKLADNKPTSTPSLPSGVDAQKKYVDDLAKKGERPTIGELFYLYLGTLNPFRRL